MKAFTSYEIFDNPVDSLIWFVVIVAIAFLLKRYASKLVSTLLLRVFQRRSNEKYTETFNATVLPALDFFIVIFIITGALRALVYPNEWNIDVFGYPLHTILSKGMEVLVLFSFAWVLIKVVEFIGYVLNRRAGRTSSKFDDQLAPFMKDALKIFIVVNVIFILLGGIFGLNISSLLAGLGIGGLAVAFAAQESIKDLFGSFTIFWDKPFTVGDQVQIGDVSGTIEKVGIRSTRIRTADKTLVTMPNKKMVDSNVENLQLRTFRRVEITIGVTYETPPEVMQKIVDELQAYFNNNKIDFPDENFVLFDSFGESSLNIRMQYFTMINPWLHFLKKKEEVNYKIIEVVTRNSGNFSYPVRDIRISPDIFQQK